MEYIEIKRGIGELRRFLAANRDWDDFGEPKVDVYGASFGVTSLYAVTLQQALPVDSYEWSETHTLREVFDTRDDSVVGFFVKVDIIYPSFLHDSQNDFLWAPEKVMNESSCLSPNAQSFNVNLPSVCRKKLLEMLLDKNQYVYHYRTLKFYTSHVLKVQKLHLVNQFSQINWLGGYISKNTFMGKQTTNGFEKSFDKLVSNVRFGERLEKLRSRRKTVFNNKKEAEKSLPKPTSKSYQIFQVGLASILWPPVRFFGQTLPLRELPFVICLKRASKNSRTMK